jgi:NADH:ubiquinone oxidoreductase subunit H
MSGILSILTWGILLLPTFWLKDYIERKFHADLQARIGPKRAGAAGWMQPGFDLLRDYRRNGISNQQWMRVALKSLALFLLGRLATEPSSTSVQILPILVVFLVSISHLIQERPTDHSLEKLLVDGRNTTRVLTALVAVILVLVGAMAGDPNQEQSGLGFVVCFFSFWVFIASGIFSTSTQEGLEAYFSRMIFGVLGFQVLFWQQAPFIISFFVSWVCLVIATFLASFSLKMRSEQRDRWAWRYLVPLSFFSLIGLVVCS